MVYSLAQVDEKFSNAGIEAGLINLSKIEVKLFPPGILTEDYPPEMLESLPLLETYQLGVVSEGDFCHNPRYPSLQGVIRCGPIAVGQSIRARLRFREVRGDLLDRMAIFFSNRPDGFKYREAVQDIFSMSSEDLERMLYERFQTFRQRAINYAVPFFEHRRIPLIIMPD